MHDFPDVAILSIRTLYPRKVSKADECKRIREALDRIMGGEIDGKPRLPEEAITYLRERIVDAAAKMAGRDKKHIPHMTTWLHQSRYLRVDIPAPESLEDAIGILNCYPNITRADPDAYMPILRLISEQIRFLRPTMGQAAASHIRVRVLRFRECVAKWPDEDLRFVPSPKRFFEEQRWNQDERNWIRNSPQNGYQSERDQTLRLIN